ncbi:MAG: response regulator [Alphaproteobacteria bacterium]|nr:response regulator [Alphaproteobacteria bacterium]MDP6563984.1 response regulator [Alphaproteobacteria bacterium]
MLEGCANRRLLVVDDEPAVGLFVRRTAEALGFEVLVATSGRQFMDAWAGFAPTAIVMDIVMPEVDGMELIQWLTKAGYDGQLIVVTGYAPDYATVAGHLAEISGRMAVCSLTKPLQLEELEAVLSDHHG